MPLRSFPLPLSVGIDICHVPRVRRLLASTYEDKAKLQRFLRRFLSSKEQDEFHKRFQHQADNNAYLNIASKHLAGRWSAKEAAIKAVTWRRVSFLDIHIATLRTGGVCAVILDDPAAASADSQPENLDVSATDAAPYSHAEDSIPQHDVVSEAAKSSHFAPDIRDLSGQILQVSISHDGDYATAVCLAARTAEG